MKELNESEKTFTNQPQGNQIRINLVHFCQFFQPGKIYLAITQSILFEQLQVRHLLNEEV